MRKQIINENWDIEEVVDLDDLAAVLFKYGSNQCGYVEAFDFDDLIARQAYDNLVNQYKEANADELTHIYLVKLPNTPQVISLLDKALYNGNERDPEAIEAVNNLCNRADCETLDSWGGCLSEGKKKKKPYSSAYCGFTDPELNIKHFNKCMGTGGLQNPDSQHLVVGDTLPNAPVADAGSSSSDGASDAGSSSGGEGGAVGESLITENDKATDINDMKSLIFELIDGFKLTTAKSSKLTLVNFHANGNKTEEVITYYPADENNTEHYNFTISGGLNGAGSWSDYLDDLSDFAQSLKKESGWEPVVIDVSSDVPDDVFSVEFNLFNPGEKKNESLTEDLIVIEPFEAKEKLDNLINQIKEQDNDDVKKSLLELLNVYLFQTVKPEDRENCNLTNDEWKEASDFAKEETDKYYEDHPEELPGTEEHAEAEDEEVEENLAEGLNWYEQKEKMRKLEIKLTNPSDPEGRGFNTANVSLEKLLFNYNICISEHYDRARRFIENVLREKGWGSHIKSSKVSIRKEFTLTPEDLDKEDLGLIYDSLINDPEYFWKNATWVNALKAILIALITKNKTLSDSVKDRILKRFDITVEELIAIINRHISDQTFFAKLKTVIQTTESLEEATAYSHKLQDTFEVPYQIKLLDQKQVENFVHELDPEELFHVGYITPVYFYSELQDKFYLVKATEMEGYTGIDYRFANVNAKDHDDRLELAKQQIKDNPNGAEGHKLNAAGDKFSTNYRDTNKLALNPEKSNEYVEYELDAEGKPVVDAAGNKVIKTKIDMNKILFYPKVGSKPKVTYYVDFYDGKGYRVIPREVLVDTLYKALVENRYGATATLSDADRKWLIKSGYGKDEQEALKKFQETHGNIPVCIFRKAQAEGVDPQEFWKAHPYSPRWSLDDFVAKVSRSMNADVATVLAVDADTVSDKELKQGAGRSPDAIDGKLYKDEAKPQVRALYSNQVYYLSGKPGTIGKAIHEGLEEETNLQEAKRYVKRYYVRPQNIFCSNKEDILKALLRVNGENCSIYSLKNLSDHDDVQELQPSDIIYYYDDGILYDKNHVKVMDYDLNVKHEEERKKFADVDAAPESQVNNEYDDRLTDADLQDKDAVANFRAINQRQLK